MNEINVLYNYILSFFFFFFCYTYNDLLSSDLPSVKKGGVKKPVLKALPCVSPEFQIP